MKKLFMIVVAVLALVACDKSAKEAEVAVASVSINPGSIEMVIGETSQLRASISPSNATEKNVSWTSSKQSVATVSESGLVSAVAEGTATITASVGGKSGTCSVTVSKGVIAVESVELNKASLELIEGESETLTTTVKPNDATDKTVTWSSSNATIATVENGKVTAVKEGEATITAAAGGKSATCKVVVAKKVIAVSSVELNKTTLELVEEESETLVATVKPDDATDKTVTWSTSNASIATVENGKVTAIKEGEATITAAAGNRSATCKVVVAKKVIAVSSVELNKTTLELVEEESETLVATVKPDDATDKTVTWSTSNASIATVENGKVTAIMTGTAFITASAGEKSVECKVSVYKKDCAPLPGVFSVSSTKKVKFSRGNLQATYDGSAWSWAFATNQYDYIGKAVANTRINGNGTVSANGTVDLFGWSTSASYLGISNAVDDDDKARGTYGGDFADWGSNAIVQEGIGVGWRTLSSEEWKYLLNSRSVNDRYCKATVESKVGLVIFPDSFSQPMGVTAPAKVNDEYIGFTHNTWSIEDWAKMEAAGAVFLPAAGCRAGASVNFSVAGGEIGGTYWSSTSYDTWRSRRMYFTDNNLAPSYFFARWYGNSVRLVQDQ